MSLHNISIGRLDGDTATLGEITGGRPALGTWQQVVLLDFDDRPRSRTVHVHVVA